MQHTGHTALPEGVPPEGLKIIRAESEQELEQHFAELAREGYVPAQNIKIHADYDDGEWKTLYVMALWKVGDGVRDESEEMFR